jgi:glycerophosphoryl diester phosphodiesterase
LISIRHSLLTRERVADLRGRGVTMIAWTVNDAARAHELISWGVDGITSDSLVLLQRLRDPASRSV